MTHKCLFCGNATNSISRNMYCKEKGFKCDNCHTCKVKKIDIYLLTIGDYSDTIKIKMILELLETN